MEKDNKIDISKFSEKPDSSSPYDFRYEEKEGEFYRNKTGLTAEIVSKLSEDKNDPDWMKEFRLKSLALYNQLSKYGHPRPKTPVYPQVSTCFQQTLENCVLSGLDIQSELDKSVERINAKLKRYTLE